MNIEEAREAIKDWCVRAAKMREKDEGRTRPHREVRDEITRQYFGIPSYLTLVTMMNNGHIPDRIIPLKEGGIYDCKSEYGISLSYQDVLNIVGPNYVDQHVQFKLIDKMDEMGAKRFEGHPELRARNAAWRVGRDVFDRMFLLLFDRPAGSPIKHNERPAGRLRFDIDGTLVTDMEINHI